MKYLPLLVLLCVVIACAGSQRPVVPKVQPTPDLLASRQLYCDLFQEQFQKYALTVNLDGPNRDVMTIWHREKPMLLVADAMMLSKPEVMEQLKERDFKFIRFTDGKKYSRTVPVQ